jgi:hypothetical protein
MARSKAYYHSAECNGSEKANAPLPLNSRKSMSWSVLITAVAYYLGSSETLLLSSDPHYTSLTIFSSRILCEYNKSNSLNFPVRFKTKTGPNNL